MGYSTVAAYAGSTILNTYGQAKTASANAYSSAFNSKVAEDNANIATQKATWAGEEGVQNAGLSEMQTAAKVGAIKANQGASGVEIGTGSNKDVVTSAREIGMLDALTIRSNAARAAYGYTTESSSDKAQSQLDKMAAKNAGTAGAINVGSTMLGGAARASQYVGSKGILD